MGKLMNPNIRRICIKCGREYHPTSSRQQCCNLPKEKTCPICGKTFQTVCSPRKESETCSVECMAQLIKQRRTASAMSTTKICKECGKEFHPKSVRDVYCSGPHMKPCVVCGTMFEYDPKRSDVTQTCSKECRYILATEHRDIETEIAHQQKTLFDRYGVTNASFIQGATEKAKQTCLERHGKEYYSQTDEYKKRVEQKSMKKYHVSHHLAAREVIDRRIENLKRDKGVVNVFQLDEVKEKSKQTLLEKTGYEYASQIPKVRDKITNTNFERYGVSHAMKLREYQDKAVRTTFERYGRSYYTQQSIADIDKWYEFISDPRKYIESHYDSVPRTAEIAEDLGVDHSTVSEYISASNSGDCVRRAKSIMEEEITKFIKSIAPNVRVYNNAKSIISPYELDLYIPEFNFAIECNPTCTHNSSFKDPWGHDPKSRSYHKEKTDLCFEKNIFLFHIFGYEWTHHNDIILSMIRNIMHTNDIRIYARNCEIRNVSSKDCRVFLNENHRQGYSNASVKLGLYYKDSLVSLMTFGTIRSTMGSGNDDLSMCWELVRFCSKLNTTVIGGADKLFKYFVKTYKPVEIRSFSDRAHTRGSLYRILGFNAVHISDPGYVWVDVHTDRGYHRCSAQKHNLRKFLHDTTIDLSKTEKQIMEEHGFAQVFDCGTILWQYKPET